MTMYYKISSFLVEWCSIFFIHPSINGNLSFILLLVIVINVAMNVGVQISLQGPDFYFLNQCPEVEFLI